MDDDKVQKFCGRQMPNPIQLNNANKLRIIFSSNNDVNGDGFSIFWKAVCGGNFSTPEGQFTSPGYPISYDDNLNCQYIINAKPQDYVLINFEAPFELEHASGCRWDYVQVEETSIINPRRRRIKKCGSTLPATIVYQGPIKVTFRTDR